MPAAAYPMKLAYLEGKTSAPIRHGVEAATQAYREGAPLIGVAGKMTEVSADPTAIDGISLHPASGVTDKPVMFLPLHRDMVMEISANAAVTVANLNIAYGIVEVSNVWVLDISEVTVVVFKIIAIEPEMIGVANPRVFVVPALVAIE